MKMKGDQTYEDVALYRELSVLESLARECCKHGRDEVRNIVEAGCGDTCVARTKDSDLLGDKVIAAVNEELGPQSGEECHGRQTQLRRLRA
jgi:hypothetical protein